MSQRDSRAAPGRSWSPGRPWGDRPTRILSGREVCHVVRTHGTGWPGVAAIAAHQLGLAAAGQLHLAGLDKHAIWHRVAAGYLHPVVRGVYAVGHDALPPGGRELAARLACGPGTYLDRLAASALHGLIDASPERVTVTVAGRNVRSRPGIDVRRVAAIDRRDTASVRGIPVTSIPRTFIDCAASEPEERLIVLLDRARIRHHVADGAFAACLERNRGRAGVAAARAVLADEGDDGYSRSKAERLLRALIREGGLPVPRYNTRLAGLEVDAVWAEERLVVEVDGRRYHGTPRAFEEDRRRDAHLAARGFTVVRFTWRRLTRARLTVLRDIAMALAVRARAA